MNIDYIVLSKHVINNHQLSAESLAVIAWVLSKHGHECKLDRAAIRVRFGWGSHTWYRVSRELKRLGFVNEIITNKGSTLHFKMINGLDSSDSLDSYIEERAYDTVEDGQL